MLALKIFYAPTPEFWSCDGRWVPRRALPLSYLHCVVLTKAAVMDDLSVVCAGSCLKKS